MLFRKSAGSYSWLQACALTAALLSTSSAHALTRFALLLGNDTGQPYRQRLQYAGRDADRLSRTLVELGHFEQDHVIVLREEGTQALQFAVAQLNEQLARVQAAGDTSLLLFYFSGHADEAGLELGNDALTYVDLRAMIQRSPATTKIVIVDACGSGELTGVRGGRPTALLDFAPRDAAWTQGVAFIASTAVGEPAQESSMLEGGFFTSHFDAGLRGAADVDRDGRVTLLEAFRYASASTTGATARTRSGPQHPTYEMNISGRNEVILTEVGTTTTGLVLPPGAGSLFVIHGPNRLIMEVEGGSSTLGVALPPGAYTVDRRSQDKLETVQTEVVAGQTRELPPFGFRPFVWSDARGSSLPLHFSVAANIGWSGIPTLTAPEWGGALTLSRVMGRLSLRATLSGGVMTRGPSATGTRLISARAAMAVVWPLVLSGPLLLEAGPQLGVGSTFESVGGRFEGAAGDVALGGLVAVTFPLGWLRFGPQLNVGARVLNLNGALSVLPEVVGGLFIGF